MIPFKHILLAIAFMPLLSQASFSQVKKKYQDETFVQTTVVVKDQTSSASDREILDAQFDIDDFGMDQVIRITTEADRPAQVEKSSFIEKDIPEALAVSEPSTQMEVPSSNLAEDSGSPVVVMQKEVAPKSSTIAEGNTKSRLSSGGRSNSFAVKSKRAKNKKVVRFKKKKRSRKGKKYSCYKF